MPLTQTIKKLISLRKEGTHWDFKEHHHKRSGEMIHDILCLANADYDGERYLIYGVRDSDYQVVGLFNTEPRKIQADILSTF